MAADWYAAGEPCPRCGDVHTRCKAHNRAGSQCKRWPLEHRDVCGLHGGKAPQTEAKAAERGMERKVAAMLVAEGIPLKEEHPLEGLLTEVWRSACAVEFYASLIADLDVPDPHKEGGPFAHLMGLDEDGEPVLASPSSYLYGPNHQGDLAPHVLVTQWEKERERHARLCKMALDANVSDRLVQVAEAQAHVMAQAITAVLEAKEVGMSPAQKAAARRVAAETIRALPSPSAGQAA